MRTGEREYIVGIRCGSGECITITGFTCIFGGIGSSQHILYM